MSSDKKKSTLTHIDSISNRSILFYCILAIASGFLILSGVKWFGLVNIGFGTLLIGDFILKNRNRAP